MNLFGGFNSVWQMLHEVLVELRGLRKKVNDCNSGIEDLKSSDTKILQVLAALTDQDSQILQALAVLTDLDRQILALLLPPPPVKFIMEFIGENSMGNVVKAAVDFQLLDNGTATATITPVDTLGNPTTMPAGASVPVWTSSDPSVNVLAAGDGLSAVLTPSGMLAVGVTITADSVLADGTTHITGTGNPIDVIAGPATGFKIVES